MVGNLSWQDCRKTFGRFLKSRGSTRCSSFSLTSTRPWQQSDVTQTFSLSRHADILFAPQKRGVQLRSTDRLQVCVTRGAGGDLSEDLQRLGDVRGNIEPRGEREIVEPSLRATSRVGPELERGAERLDVARIVDNRAVPAVFHDLGKT